MYAASTIWIVNAFFGGGVVVGVFMFLASLHDDVSLLSFITGGFFVYTTMFGVHTAEVSAFRVTGLPGETLAALASMFIGAAIGLTTKCVSLALE